MGQTSVSFQVIVILIHIWTAVLLVVGAVLVGDANTRVNKDRETDMCFLYSSKDNPQPITLCVFSICSLVLAAVGFVILMIMDFVKIILGFMKNKVFFIVEFVILLFSGIFALTIASILTSGWNATCKSKDSGTYCHDSFAEEVTAAVVVTVTAVIGIIGSTILTVIIAIVSFNESDPNSSTSESCCKGYSN